ncbi:MAG: AzlC family ABC transporter permease [Bacillota bacterium]
MEVNIKNKLSLQNGLKAGFPVAIGYLPIALTFGLLARNSGLSFINTFLMSVMVFAGASQFVAVNLLALGTGIGEVVLTTFILNFRHFLMSASLSQKVKENIPQNLLALLSFGITDETFSVASMQDEKFDAKFLFGLNLISYLAWISGTAAGHCLGATLPEIIQASMGIALYAMFIGLLVPNLKKSKAAIFTTIIAIIFSSIFYFLSDFINISEGWEIVLVTIFASFIATIFFPEGVVNNGE